MVRKIILFIAFVVLANSVLADERLEIASLRIINEESASGENVYAKISVDVHGLNDELEIFAVIPELGIRTTAGPFNPSGRIAKPSLFLEIPEDAEPGVYWVRFTIRDDEGRRRVKYRPVEIV